MKNCMECGVEGAGLGADQENLGQRLCKDSVGHMYGMW